MSMKGSDVGWWKVNWRYNAVALALLAAVFSALTLVNDTNVLRNVIAHKNGLTAVLAYLIIGSWVGVVANLLYNKLFGRFIEPDFKGEIWVNGKFQLLAAGAGILAAIYTFSYLLVAKDGDPSILIALSNFAIVYLGFYDRIQFKVPLKKTLFSAGLVLLGAGLAVVERIDITIQLTLSALLTMLLVSATSDAASRVCEKAASNSGGGVNLAFWRFLWLAIFATIFSTVVAMVTGSFGELASLLSTVTFGALPWVTLTMFLAYGGNTLRIVAQRHGHLSTVAIVRSAQIAMAVPLTLLVAQIPNSGFILPSQPLVWAIRLVGTILIILGIRICLKGK